MRLLHVISSTNPKGGGPVEGIKQLWPQYRSLGISAEIACCDAPDSPWLKDALLPPVHALGPSRSGFAFTPLLLPWLKAHSSEFDAVIVNGLWQYPGLAVRWAAHAAKLPYFVFAHGMLDPWFKRTYPLKHLKKWMYWPWGQYPVLRDARAVIFTSEEERLLARQSFWLYHVNEAVTSYGTAGPPLDPAGLLRARERFLERWPEIVGKRNVLFMGRLHEKKGCDLLLEAFARVMVRHENLHLIVAGPDGSVGPTLHQRAKLLNIQDHVTWTGMVEGDQKWGAFQAAEVFCLPSHQENFGIVVAEALASARPVLISNKVNIWREVHADAVGFVDEDSVDGTEANLERWLALSPSSYEAMSRRSLESFQARFHTAHAAERLRQIIVESEIKAC